MEHQHTGISNVILSIVSMVMAWTLKDVQVALSISASFIAIISGAFAIRYYIISTNKIKDK